MKYKTITDKINEFVKYSITNSLWDAQIVYDKAKETFGNKFTMTQKEVTELIEVNKV